MANGQGAIGAQGVVGQAGAVQETQMPQGSQGAQGVMGFSGAPQGVESAKGFEQSAYTNSRADIARKLGAIFQQAPSLQHNPQLALALAYNAQAPMPPQYAEAIAKAHNAVKSMQPLGVQDYKHMMDVLYPHTSFWGHVGNAFGDVGSWINGNILEPIGRIGGQAAAPYTSGQNIPLAPVPGGNVSAPPIMPVVAGGSEAAKLSAEGLAKIGQSLRQGNGITDATQVPSGALGGGPTVAGVSTLPPLVQGSKGVINTVADQFDSPEHLYRYVATVEHKYGPLMAALALLPTVAGGVVGGLATGGAGSEEGALAAEEAATGLFGSGLAGAESDMTAAQAAARTAALRTQRILDPLAKVAGAPFRAVTAVANSPVTLGATAGFEGAGQVLFRQAYMDSRNGTTWAKQYPMLSPTLGQDLAGRGTVLSGAIDALASFVVPDAIGAAGRVVGKARSLEGVGGLVGGAYRPSTEELSKAQQWFGVAYEKAAKGRYFSGTSMEKVDDAYNSLPSARNAINVIAQMGSASDIISLDKRLAPIADDLAKAKVVNADGSVNMERSVENVKDIFRAAAHANELLTSSQLPLISNKLLYVMEEAAKTKINFDHIASQMPMYTDLANMTVENHYVTLGDKNSLGFIRDALRLTVGDKEAKMVVDTLAATSDPYVWRQAIKKSIASMMQSSIVKAVYAVESDPALRKFLLGKYDGVIKENLDLLLNYGGPGDYGKYGTAVLETGGTIDLSRVVAKAKEVVASAAGGNVPSEPAMMESWVKAITEHEQAIADAEAKTAAKTQRQLQNKAAELDRRVARNKEARANQTLSGYEQITGRLNRALANGSITAEEKLAIEGFIQAIGPDLFDNVRLSILAASESGASGQYSWADQLITLFAGALRDPEGLDRTLIHEMFHHLSQFVPEEHLTGLNRELESARIAFVRQNGVQRMVEWGKNNGYLKATYEETVRAGRKLDETETKFARLQKLVEEHTGSAHIPIEQVPWSRLPSVQEFDNYRLKNIDEWFAEGMYDRWAGKIKSRNPLMELGYKILRSIFAGINRISGRATSEAIFQGFMQKGFDDKQAIGSLGQRLFHGASVEQSARIPFDLPAGDPLAGANHDVSDVEHTNPVNGDGQTLASAIFPEENARLYIPSYNELDNLQRRMIQTLVKNVGDIRTNIAANIASQEEKVADLEKAIAAATDDAQRTKLQKQLVKEQGRLELVNEAGFIADARGITNVPRALWNSLSINGMGVYNWMDKWLNTFLFKPFALATGGWATRVSMSEDVLNIIRQGPLNFAAAELASRAAKHEAIVAGLDKTLTRATAEGIASIAGKVLQKVNLIEPGQKLFKTEREMGNFVAAIHGIFAGTEASLLKAIGKEKFLESAIHLVYLNDGHIVSPLLNASHGASGNYFVIDNPTAADINAATYKYPGVTNEPSTQKVRLQRIFRDYEPGQAGYKAFYLRRAQYYANSSTAKPIVEAYANAYKEARDAGMAHQDAMLTAQIVGHQKALEVFDAIPASTKKMMLRTTAPLAPDHPLSAAGMETDALGNPVNYSDLKKKELARMDWATAATKSIEGVFRGPSGAFHDKLMFDMAGIKDSVSKATGALPGNVTDFGKAYMDGQDLRHFNSIPGPDMDQPMGGLGKLDPSKITGKIHDKFLAPIVNNLSRNPMYIIEFTKERELLNAKVLAGDLSSEQADVLAQSRASYKAIRYVHNPKDKLKLENMMRLQAPFYFAQNQAWRRLGRVAFENPGAFEQYVKAMWLAQEAEYKYDQKTGTIGVPIPGSAWFMEKFIGVKMPIELSPNSLRTVLPWAGESGVAPGVDTLLGSLVPKGTPMIGVAANFYLEHAAGDMPALDNFLGRYVVGPQGLGQPLITQIIPNSIIGNVIKGAIGWAVAEESAQRGATLLNQGFFGRMGASYITTFNEVLQAEMDNVQKKYWNESAKVPPPAGWLETHGTEQDWRITYMLTQSAAALDPRGNPEAYANLISSTNSKTMFLWMMKTAISGTSPMSALVGRANLKMNSEFYTLVNQSGDITKAATQFLKKYPWATAETVFTSKSVTGTSYPETAPMGQWMLHNAEMVKSKYANIAPYLFPMGQYTKGAQPYDAMAHFLQNSFGVRQQDTPAGFVKSYEDAMFNYYLYNVLQPWGAKLEKDGYTKTSVQNWLNPYRSNPSDATTWGLLQSFGYKYAPAAYADYTAGAAKANRADAMVNLQSAWSDPSLTKRYPILAQMREQLQPALDWYNASRKNGATEAQIAPEWNKGMDALAKQYPDLSTVIEGLFRPMAPNFTY